MKANVLILDIETSPIVAFVWGLKDQNIALNQIHKDSSVMSWAAKWLGAKPVMYEDRRNDVNDKRILTKLWKLLDKADIVLTQNGQRFDIPKVNARFIAYGMPPPSPFRHIDTYQIVKRVAAFTSNKLEYLTKTLCAKHVKTSHTKFPGMTLWDECLKGNKKSWDEMRHYNIKDVLSTEELYERIKAWAPETMAKAFEGSNPTLNCLTCGHDRLTKRGYMRTKKSLVQRYQCQQCGAWQKGESIKPKKIVGGI